MSTAKTGASNVRMVPGGIVKFLGLVALSFLIALVANLIPSCSGSSLTVLPSTHANIVACRYAQATGPDQVVNAISTGKIARPSPVLVKQLQNIVLMIALDGSPDDVSTAEAKVDVECSAIVGR